MRNTRPIQNMVQTGIATGGIILFSFFAGAGAQASTSPYHHAGANPAGTYRIDPDHSTVTFTIGHAGVATAVGRFDKISGDYRIDPANPGNTRVDIKIEAKSVDTNQPMRDKDLRGPDFLDANSFPIIRFIGTRYKKTGKKSGILTGKLTLHGKTRMLSLKIHEVGAGDVSALPKPWGGYLSGYDAMGTIRRSDFGVTTYPKMIGDKIHLYISVEGIRTKQ